MIQIMAKLVSTCQQLQIWHGQLKQGVEMSNLTDLTNYIILYNWFRRVFELSSKVLHGLANLPGGFHNFQVLFTSFHIFSRCPGLWWSPFPSASAWRSDPTPAWTPVSRHDGRAVWSSPWLIKLRVYSHAESRKREHWEQPSIFHLHKSNKIQHVITEIYRVKS